MKFRSGVDATWFQTPVGSVLFEFCSFRRVAFVQNVETVKELFMRAKNWNQSNVQE